MKNIFNNIDFLNMIAKSKKPMRIAMIKNASKDQINCVCECILNTLIGNVKLKQDKKDEIKRFKKPMRKLLKKNSIKIKKNLIIQNGGFLPALIPTILSIILPHLTA